MLRYQPPRKARLRAAITAARRLDLTEPAERLVLAIVLGIAALISYTHMRFVWETLGAPWPYLGPLTVDGLFAAAWLRMRRRRRDGVKVGALAWIAMVVAFLACLGGNIGAAFGPWLTAHRDAVAPFVYAWPAIAFGLVWELVTGHARRVTKAVTGAVTKTAPAVQPKKTVTPKAKAICSDHGADCTAIHPPPVTAEKPKPLTAAERKRNQRARAKETAA